MVFGGITIDETHFNSLPREGVRQAVKWREGVYTLCLTNKPIEETPPYTLPGEGIAQAAAFNGLHQRRKDSKLN
ncbi:hypothetical protein HYN43_012445 [Mucilaginibacter celer]|uniref:Uncharacterized protein n=1 Tax=Mucilaginibacter celer TaxID=2305508 RepID=A0A494VLD7_9SPHI|nr:hypothetical protein HYN43_012445 [Mucilaginibacter celer]